MSLETRINYQLVKQAEISTDYSGTRWSGECDMTDSSGRCRVGSDVSKNWSRNRDKAGCGRDPVAQEDEG